MLVCHWPAELHVCTELPEHCVAPGTHTPPHDPALHTKGHVVVDCH